MTTGSSRVRHLAGLACALAIVVAHVSVSRTADAQSSNGDLHVCHAGSLLAAFTQVEEEFTTQHPGVTITDTSGGSVDLVRRFAAGTLPCDVIAPADHLLIDTMLKPARLAGYTIVFASGRMVLSYSSTDSRANSLPVSGTFAPPASVPEVTGKWYETLTAPGVRMAGAHPFVDPGGYRAHMMFELAQAHYRIPGLYNTLLQHYQVNVADPSAPAPVLGRDFNFQITYEHNAARIAAADRSFRYATLPVAIDLSTASRRYAASVTIPGLGLRGSAASVTIPASAAAWGVTVAANTRHRSQAIAFVASLLGTTGRAALTGDGPAPIVPARVTRADHAKLPAELQALTRAD